ncbi:MULTISPECIES: nucleoside permease [unclassified Arcicella]|uniref:nucleoside permease n=1 Tax=unclassified Arcicella TaxID=2644986 RepID=UPI002856AA90|nr:MULTISPECIES: nucleoside permease [unclassified Arcicella]MDR6560141.1 nucleoside transporter [Arcicella sp. BE51]MDR6810252.1 nucleoside transporter [Arcicella sp. BE140]MDR6821602.1 nucleoside transporter [Arcicella sp. BE139]
MRLTTRIQLMFMMFLMFSTWGAWYGQMGKYLFTSLHANGDQIGSAYATFSIASIFAPFFVGLIADRFFSAQKVMGVLNLLGAVILYFLIQNKDADTFFWYILAYTLTFAPNLALSSSIAMNQMKDPGKEFPPIRVLGTIAWIVVTNIIGAYEIGDKVTIFQIAMFTSIAWGIYAFTLPNTPPKATGTASVSQILGTDSFVLFKDRSFLIFFISSVLVCIPLAFYYAHANLSLTESHMTNVENKMSLGQVSEVLFMLLIPFALQKFGIKKMLIVGLIAWIIRFICFGYGDGISSEWLLYLAIVLHGVCYDFFFVTGQIYTDNKAGDKIKNSAQGLITLATYGVGMGIGSFLSGKVLTKYTTDNVHDWTSVWMVPAGIAAVVLILFVIFFHDKKTEKLVE